MSKTELDALYRVGKSDTWQATPAVRTDWRIAKTWISQHLPRPKSILDVGCFDGAFLSSLGSIQCRYGIEIHDFARARAEEAGISMIGTDFGAMTETKLDFDVATAFDVIEHTHNPLDFLAALSGATRKRGIVIVSTGNTNAWSWKLLGSRYWYSAIAEHLSFVNPNWCTWAAPRVGLEPKLFVTFSHATATWRQWSVDVAKSLFYSAFPTGFAWLRMNGFGAKEYQEREDLRRYPPAWGSARDHFICLFHKK